MRRASPAANGRLAQPELAAALTWESDLISDLAPPIGRCVCV